MCSNSITIVSLSAKFISHRGISLFNGVMGAFMSGLLKCAVLFFISLVVSFCHSRYDDTLGFSFHNLKLSGLL